MTKNSKEMKNICTATMNAKIQNMHVLYIHFNVLFATIEYKNTVFPVKIILSPKKYAPVDPESERLLRSRNIFYFPNMSGYSAN